MLTAPWLDVSTLSLRSCGQSWRAVESPHLCPCLLGGMGGGKAWRPIGDAGTDAAQPSPKAQTLPQEAPCLGLEPALGGLCLCTEGSSARGPRGDRGVCPQRAGLFLKGWEGLGGPSPRTPVPPWSPVALNTSGSSCTCPTPLPHHWCGARLCRDGVGAEVLPTATLARARLCGVSRGQGDQWRPPAWCGGPASAHVCQASSLESSV